MQELAPGVGAFDPREIDVSPSVSIWAPDTNQTTPLAKDSARSSITPNPVVSAILSLSAGNDFHSFRVLSVVDGGPASQPGVKPDDVILDVDGVQAAKLMLEQIRSQFKEDRATRVLTIQRKGERVSVKVMLRRVV